MQGLAQFLEQGGTLMYVNLVVSIITLAIIIDRAIFFLGKGSVNARAFLEQIRSHGRVFEFGLVFDYKMRTGALFDDVLNAPGMFLRGKLALSASNIEGRDEVRRIFEACETAAKKEAP